MFHYHGIIYVVWVGSKPGLNHSDKGVDLVIHPYLVYKWGSKIQKPAYAVFLFMSLVKNQLYLDYSN